MLTLFNRNIKKGHALIILTWLLLVLPLCYTGQMVAKSSSVSVLDSLSTAIDTPFVPFETNQSATLSADTILSDSILADSMSTWNDSLEMISDSLLTDTGSHKPVGGGLTDVVNFKAKDSLVFCAGNLAWLYGESEVTYTDINLTAERIQLSLDSSLVHANGVPDTTSTTGKLIGKPVFKDNSGEYETRTMSYNFKTAKGYICDVTTQQGDGYVTGGITKKMPDNDIFLENGRYTTCDQTDCPHFYIELTKARVRPNKNIVTGPAYLVVADVPLPVAIPFGFFPFTKSYSSGIIMPSYGADQQRGLYLRDGGYYFAINDFVDLSVKGELYTKGTWGISADSRYAMRYKFKGNFQFSYLVQKTGDKGMPDYSESNNMRVVWSHSQDSRFNPNLSLSASVNFSTSGYDRSNTRSIYSNDLTTSTKQSSINASYRVPNTNWSLTASASITQRTQDSTLDVSLPQLTASMTTWYPFKRKHKTGSDKWYEKISMTYNLAMNNSVKAKETEFGSKNLLRDWNNGIKHSLPVQATFTLAKYIQIQPSMRFTDRMYSHKTLQHYDPGMVDSRGNYGGIVKDTVYGFYNAFDFSSSVSASTKLYGMYKPLWKSKLFAVRHVLSPAISFNYTPDFSDPKYRSWGVYYLPDSTAVGGRREVKYNFFQGYSQGTTSGGRNGSVSISLSNNIEAKIRSDQDSTGYKKISIIDNLQTSLSYNMIADSMRWSSIIPVSATFKWGKNSTMNLSASFDTYMYDYDGRPINVPRWEVGKLPRLQSTGYSWSYSLNNQKLAKLFGFGSDSDDDDDDDPEYDLDSEDGYVDEMLDPTSIEAMQRKQEKRNKKIKEKPTGKWDADGYLIWTVPWSLNFSYTMRYAYKSGKDNFDKVEREWKRGIIHSATLSGTLQPTKGWNFSFNASYDFNLGRVTYMNVNASRDMHCWALTASLNPMGQYASFNVNIAVKAQMLSDLKYEKTSVSRSNKIDWYDD